MNLNDPIVIVQGLWARLAQSSGKPRWFRKAVISALTAQICENASD